MYTRLDVCRFFPYFVIIFCCYYYYQRQYKNRRPNDELQFCEYTKARERERERERERNKVSVHLMGLYE